MKIRLVTYKTNKIFDSSEQVAIYLNNVFTIAEIEESAIVPWEILGKVEKETMLFSHLTKEENDSFRQGYMRGCSLIFLDAIAD